jgi:hypothetical protein
MSPTFEPEKPALTTGGVQPKKQTSSTEALRLSMKDILAPGQSETIQDLASDWYFSANQPVRTTAPSSYRPRQSGFIPGANQIWTPGDDKGAISFDALRILADSLDLLRIIIETRKDHVAKLNWQINVKLKRNESPSAKKERALADPNVKKLTDFFKKPDGFHTWRQWITMLLEDTLVIDAASIYIERDLQGRIASLMPIAGDTINRLLTDQGITPRPPDPAYQQVVYGTPAAKFTTDDLLYAMKNERTNRRYGYSPVEQILVTIAIALKRQEFQLAYYTSGNMPEALCFLPPNLPPDRIKQVQEWFDTVLAGDLQKRRRLTFLPGYGTSASGGTAYPNVIFPKEVLLKDAMDDWLVRVICYAFSIDPQPLQQSTNRASAQSLNTLSIIEGIQPTKAYVEQDICNRIIEMMGLSEDYEFAWEDDREVDPLKQAQIDNILCPKILTVNQILESRGLDRREEPQCDMVGVYGVNGFIPITQKVVQPGIQPGGTSGNSAHEAAKRPKTAGKLNPNEIQGGASSKIVKIMRVNGELRPGMMIHDELGDLAYCKDFFAYDAATNTALVKGDVDIIAAMEELGLW